MRLRIETSPKTPLTPEQKEQAKHYKQVVHAHGNTFISVIKKRHRYEPACWPFNRWHNTILMAAIPAMVRLNEESLKNHTEVHLQELSENNLQLSLNEIQRAQNKANSSGWFGLHIKSLWGVLTLVVLASLISNNQPLTSQRTTSLSAVPTANVSNPVATTIDPDSQSSLGAVGRAKLVPMTPAEAVKKADQNGGLIRLRQAKAGAKTLVMFSDPLCKHCRAFEETVALIPLDIGLQVIPVAYLQGSKPFVSHILCSAVADQGRRWSALMSAAIKADVDQQCESGPSRSDENSILFARAGLNSTPTLMILETGLVYNSDLSANSVIEWLRK